MIKETAETASYHLFFIVVFSINFELKVERILNEKGIILIGPMGAGKSTIGELISQKLNVPQRSMDEHRWAYYQEIGYDREYARKLDEKEGPLGVYRYWKQFEIHALERILQEHKNSVIDFGAGHSVYEGEVYLARAKRALAPFKHVFLLQPSPDKTHSLKILNVRNKHENDVELELNRHFIEHKSNYELAKQYVFTDGAEPEDTVTEILMKMGKND